MYSNNKTDKIGPFTIYTSKYLKKNEILVVDENKLNMVNPFKIDMKIISEPINAKKIKLKAVWCPEPISKPVDGGDMINNGISVDILINNIIIYKRSKEKQNKNNFIREFINCQPMKSITFGSLYITA